MRFDIDSEIVDQIAMFALYADMNANLNLKRRIIDSKKEYISDFTKRFTGFINGPLSTGLSAKTMRVPHKKKKHSGCDTAIIITSHGLSKIALSKYKLPSFEQPELSWDKNKESANKSLFSTQLERQKKYNAKFAVFQKFLNKQVYLDPQKPDKELASCVWHSDIMFYDRQYRKSKQSKWDTRQLLDMFAQSGATDIGTVLKKVCLEPVSSTVEITEDISTFIKEQQLPSRVLAINVLN